MTLDLATRMRPRELDRNELINRSQYMFVDIPKLKVGQPIKIEDYFGNFGTIIPKSIEQLSQTTVKVIDELGCGFRLLNV